MKLKPGRWTLLRRIGVCAFFILIAALLASQARTIEWSKVLVSLRRFEAGTLWLAALAAAASYCVYSCVDLFARAYTGKNIPRLLSMAIAVVSYSFNLNLGSLVGSVGLRYRLYSRFGVKPELIGRIVGLSLVTNWSGYFLVAGIAFSFRFVRLPPGFDLGTLGMQWAGLALLTILAAYVGACAFSRRRTWRIRNTEIGLPSARLVLAQIALSSLNWLLMATVIYVLLSGRIDFAAVLAVFLLSCIVGAATHVPAGLGILEAVFIGVLGGRIQHHELLAALLAYRGIYFLAPLVLASALYFWLEARPRSALPAGRIASDVAGG